MNRNCRKLQIACVSNVHIPEILSKQDDLINSNELEKVKRSMEVDGRLITMRIVVFYVARTTLYKHCQ